MTAAAFHEDDVTVEEGWGQGRATYGGLVAALLVAHARGMLPDPSTPLRSMTCSFVAPVAPGPVRIEGTFLRGGASVSQIQTTMMQDGAYAAVLLASFGAPRQSTVQLDATQRARRPAYPDPAQVASIPFVAGMMPDFFQHVELKVAAGGFPFSGAAEPDFGGWMRFRDPVDHVEVEHLVGLVDAWPPAVSPLFAKPTPMSSLAWTLELFETPRPHSGPDFWQYEVRTDGCAEGYGHTRALIWDNAGTLTGVSRQTVTVFG